MIPVDGLGYAYGMAIMTIRSTYALDAETVRTLEDVARRWGVSKSEALRRAIRTAAGQKDRAQNRSIAALSKLQRSLGLSAGSARAWGRRVKQERQASRQEIK